VCVSVLCALYGTDFALAGMTGSSPCSGALVGRPRNTKRKLQSWPRVSRCAEWVHADASIDQSKVFDLDWGMARFQHVTGPATIVILSFDAGEPQQLWFPNEGAGLRRSPCFERLPNLTLLRRFPDEGLKVLNARIEPGHRVMLKTETASADVH
jgi:hypothetical protein